MNQPASLNGADPMTTRLAIGPEWFKSTDHLTIDEPCEDCQNTGFLGGGTSGAVCGCLRGARIGQELRDQVIKTVRPFSTEWVRIEQDHQSVKYPVGKKAGDSIPKGVE